jgi:hypothetical protein
VTATATGSMTDGRRVAVAVEGEGEEHVGIVIVRVVGCIPRKMAVASGWPNETRSSVTGAEEAELSEHRSVSADRRETGTVMYIVQYCRPILRCGFGKQLRVRALQAKSRTLSS